MAIIRSTRGHLVGFTKADNVIIHHEKLTAIDKIVLIFLLSLETDAAPTNEDIEAGLGLGKKTVEKSIKSLRHAGYLRRRLIGRNRGQWLYELDVYEDFRESPADYWDNQNRIHKTVYPEPYTPKGVDGENKTVSPEPYTPKGEDGLGVDSLSKSHSKSPISKTKELNNNNSGGENFSNSPNDLTPSGNLPQSSHDPAKNGKGHNVPDNAEEQVAAGNGPARSELHIKYEKEIGRLSEYIADELAEMVKEYGEGEVIKSIKIAADSNVRSLRYMRGVCKRSAAGETNGHHNGNGKSGATPADDDEINAILRRDGLI